jgi:hypothetical protein
VANLQGMYPVFTQLTAVEIIGVINELTVTLETLDELQVELEAIQTIGV